MPLSAAREKIKDYLVRGCYDKGLADYLAGRIVAEDLATEDIYGDFNVQAPGAFKADTDVAKHVAAVLASSVQSVEEHRKELAKDYAGSLEDDLKWKGARREVPLTRFDTAPPLAGLSEVPQDASSALV